MAPTLTFTSSTEPPAGGLRVDVDPTAGRVVLTGELDRATCGHLVAACQLLTAAGPPIWMLDLAGLTFCDAPGLRSLARARHAAADAGATLVLAGASPFLRRLLARCGLEDVLTPIARTSPVPVDVRVARPAEVAPAAGTPTLETAHRGRAMTTGGRTAP